MAKVVGVFSPDGPVRLGDMLNSTLRDSRWSRLDAAIAYVKHSGVRHLAGSLADFCKRTAGSAQIACGIDQAGSSLEGVQLLYQILHEYGGELFIVHNPMGNPSPTFHPKLWGFESGDRREAALFLGSGNLTQGGLFSNYEAGVCITASTGEDDSLLTSIRSALDYFADANNPEVVRVEPSVLQRLHDQGDLPTEAQIRRSTAVGNSLRAAKRVRPGVAPLFRGRSVRRAPEVENFPELPGTPIVEPSPPASAFWPDSARSLETSTHRRLYIVIQPRKKTEVYLVKAVLREDPVFFGAPFRGLTAPKRADNTPQPQPDPLPIVSITLFGRDGRVVKSIKEHPLKMWTYTYGRSANDDFRLTFPSDIHQVILDDSVLVIERNADARPSEEYALEIYPPGHPEYEVMHGKCTQPVPNSSRRYGWE